MQSVLVSISAPQGQRRLDNCRSRLHRVETKAWGCIFWERHRFARHQQEAASLVWLVLHLLKQDLEQPH